MDYENLLWSYMGMMWPYMGYMNPYVSDYDVSQREEMFGPERREREEFLRGRGFECRRCFEQGYRLGFRDGFRQGRRTCFGPGFGVGPRR